MSLQKKISENRRAVLAQNGNVKNFFQEMLGYETSVQFSLSTSAKSTEEFESASLYQGPWKTQNLLTIISLDDI